MPECGPPRLTGRNPRTMDVIFGCLVFVVGVLAVFGLISSLPPSGTAPPAAGGGHGAHH
jgi:hypothetical protein